ncbi:unnamed protein product [Didymodactylos carnosus]|nr:unnamed protein product [Didymodactylos carnosus]CAF4457696.1 unnamed protein product [Didymodactylos carnosus]
MDSIFPNSQQTLSSNMDSIFLRLLSTPTALALMDSAGYIFVILPSLPGFYSSTTGSDSATSPGVSVTRPCISGTYNNQTGSVGPCKLCSRGLKNSGNDSVSCAICDASSFCPLGSTDDVSYTALVSVVQALSYPTSPESVIFDDILIQNMFRLGTSGHCVVVSPLFWALIVTGLAIMILLLMAGLKLCIKHPHGKKARKYLKHVFKQTDFVGEGELWVGGLASFAIVVLVSFAYSFSNSYLNQYPIENVGNSNFACDRSIRNAKFDTSLQSLGIPATENEQTMFDLLNEQTFKCHALRTSIG